MNKKVVSVSVIVPVYKDAEGLRDTLESLMKQSLSSERYEVIVANDGHDSNISEVCKSFGVKEVSTEVNRGSYVARNLAINEAKGEYLLFTDADIKVNREWIERYLEMFKKGFDYIGSPVVIDQQKIQSLTNKYVDLIEFESKEVFELMHFSATANVGVRRKVIDELGLFDVRLLSAGDYEFGDRVYRSGKYKMFFNEENIVVHPPRNYKAYFKKLRRLAKGERHLNALYPGRFKHLDKSAIMELRNALYVPPAMNKLQGLEKVRILLLHWMYQYYRAFFNIWYQWTFARKLKNRG